MRVTGSECSGSHRFFVSEPQVINEDKVSWVILICTSCGEARRILIPLDPTKAISII
jgi:hypothetical protein